MKKFLFFNFFFCFFIGFSQVGIGTVVPNSSATLDVVSTDKGVLLPRVALTGTNDTTTISNGNTDALLIYNNATVVGLHEVTPGFYYWNEAQNKWIGLTQKNIVSVDDAYGHVTGRTIKQHIPHAAGVNLTTYWNGTPTLSGGVSFSNGVFTVATAGFYQITASFSFGTNGYGARSANIRVNNSALIGYQNIAPVSNDRTGMNLSAGIYMNAGDNVRILVYQGSGIGLITDGAIGGNFSITKTGN
jgi:hypothetical protein